MGRLVRSDSRVPPPGANTPPPYPTPPLLTPIAGHTQNRYSVLFAFAEAGEATHARTGAAAFASSLEVELRSAGVPAAPGNLRAVLVTNPVPEVPKCMPIYS